MMRIGAFNDNATGFNALITLFTECSYNDLEIELPVCQMTQIERLCAIKDYSL